MSRTSNPNIPPTPIPLKIILLSQLVTPPLPSLSSCLERLEHLGREENISLPAPNPSSLRGGDLSSRVRAEDYYCIHIQR